MYPCQVPASRYFVPGLRPPAVHNSARSVDVGPTTPVTSRAQDAVPIFWRSYAQLAGAECARGWRKERESRYFSPLAAFRCSDENAPSTPVRERLM
jgi:hypothetical protein